MGHVLDDYSPLTEAGRGYPPTLTNVVRLPTTPPPTPPYSYATHPTDTRATIALDRANRALATHSLKTLRPLTFILTVAALTMLFLLSGCSTIARAIDNNAAIAEAVVIMGVQEAVESHPRAEWHAEAQSIARFATEIQTLAEFTGKTIPELQALALQRIAGKDYSPAERQRATLLVMLVVDTLQRKTEDGVLPAEQTLRLNQVLGWVISATQAYTGAA